MHLQHTLSGPWLRHFYSAYAIHLQNSLCTCFLLTTQEDCGIVFATSVCKFSSLPVPIQIVEGAKRRQGGGFKKNLHAGKSPLWPSMQQESQVAGKVVKKASTLQPLRLPGVPSGAPRTASKGAMLRQRLPMRMSPGEIKPPSGVTAHC